MLLLLLVCLVVCLFVRVWDVRHPHKKRVSNVKLPLALMTIGRWWLFSIPHLLWHGASINIGHLRTNNTHICWWAVGSLAVATRFYDLDMLRIKFKHPLSKCDQNFSSYWVKATALIFIMMSKKKNEFNSTILYSWPERDIIWVKD